MLYNISLFCGEKMVKMKRMGLFSCQTGRFAVYWVGKEVMGMKKRRLWYAGAAVLLLLIEIYIGLFVRDGFIRPYFGDVLVTALLCCVCRVGVPKGVRLLPVYVFAFSAVVEVTQYFDLVKLLGWEHNALIATLMGRSFAWADILCYAAGCAAFWAAEYALRRHGVRLSERKEAVE